MVCGVFYYGIDRETYRFVEYNGSFCYRSSQMWFEDSDDDFNDSVIRDILGDEYESEYNRLCFLEDGGCGLISAADLVAYYSIVNPSLSSLYQHSSFNYNNDYYNHLTDVEAFISPWNVALHPVNISTPFGEFHGTLGVTPHMYVNGLQQYCNNLGVQIEGHTALAWTDDYLNDFLIEAFDAGCLPVIYIGGKLLPFYTNETDIRDNILDAEQPSGVLKYRFHWVNILGYKIDNNSGKRFLYVSSWSDVYILDFDDILSINSNEVSNLFRSELYYFECEAQIYLDYTNNIISIYKFLHK